MKFNKLCSLLNLALLCLSVPLWGQSLSQTVIGNSGAYSQNNDVGNLHWTVGEVSVEQYASGLILSQGFHQLYNDLLITATWDNADQEFTVRLYPNPASDWLQIECDAPGEKQVMLYNLLGQQMQKTSFAGERERLDVAGLPSGIYLLALQHRGKTVRTFKIQKT